jgi:hypothetical protein
VPFFRLSFTGFLSLGYVDNIGSAVLWLASASLKERASLFSEIATAFLKV